MFCLTVDRRSIDYCHYHILLQLHIILVVVSGYKQGKCIIIILLRNYYRAFINIVLVTSTSTDINFTYFITIRSLSNFEIQGFIIILYNIVGGV